jgi:hypothetical protein
MEGDFNQTGHILAQVIDCHWYGCDSPKFLFSYDVQPRHIESWDFDAGDDSYEVNGSSQCGHLHGSDMRY